MNYLPGALLIFLFSAIIAFAFHLWKGGSIFRLILLLFFAIIGFCLGQWIGIKLKTNFFVIGWVQGGIGIIFSILFTLLASWLSNIRDEK